VRPEQSVHLMAEEVLERQAKALVERAGCSPREALEAVLRTDAARELEALRDGSHARERARDWQDNLLRERTLERLEHMVRLEASPTKGRYSWLEGYLERLEGKEARRLLRAGGGDGRPEGLTAAPESPEVWDRRRRVEVVSRESASKEAKPMCYSYREYRMEQEARRQREEEERRRREEQAKKAEKVRAKEERELVKA
jgi:colicin import membrane protein